MGNRLLMGCTALLYLGPLLAGLAGQGWGTALIFAVIFALWLAILMPKGWPRSVADWQKSGTLVHVAGQVGIQLLLIVILFAIGRGVGAVIGALPLYHPYLPLALSFVAIPLARLALGGRDLDSATAGPDPDAVRLAAYRMTEPLDRLDPATAPERIAAHLGAISTEIGVPALREAMIARVAQGKASPVSLTALTLLASDSRLAKGLTPDLSARILAALPEDAGVVRDYAARLTAAIGEDPARRAVLPAPGALRAKAERMPGSEAAAALSTLAATLDRAT